MNMQAIMKQAQNLQKEMLKTKEEIDNKEFQYKNTLVEIKTNGKKEILGIKIFTEEIDKDDIETIEDMILVAINSAFKEVDKYTEEKMSKYSRITGLF